MKTTLVAPSVGESITEVSILKWNKKSGEAVKKGDVLLEIESEKATVEVIAENSGVLTIIKAQGTTVPIGETLGTIDDSISATASPSNAPVASTQSATTTAPTSTPSFSPAAHAGAGAISAGAGSFQTTVSPSVRRVLTEQGLNPDQVAASTHGTGRDGRLTKGDAMQIGAGGMATATAIAPSPLTRPNQTPAQNRETTVTKDQPGDRRVPMSRLRMKIAERLVHAQSTAAILTTFNEVDMSAVMQIRSQKKDAFKTKYGASLSFMSFFTRGVVESLKLIPAVNAFIDGNDSVFHDYFDIGIAVGTPRGLVVPVLRDAGSMGFVQIEKKMAEIATKARDGKLSIAEMSGGTFTISNGGTYGSLLSTPILNPPQSGILGMHKIMDRPVVVNGQVVARPMMYLALSYDHRMIDGKEAVTFLVTLKDLLENPEKLGLAELHAV